MFQELCSEINYRLTSIFTMNEPSYVYEEEISSNAGNIREYFVGSKLTKFKHIKRPTKSVFLLFLQFISYIFLLN